MLKSKSDESTSRGEISDSKIVIQYGCRSVYDYAFVLFFTSIFSDGLPILSCQTRIQQVRWAAFLLTPCILSKNASRLHCYHCSPYSSDSLILEPTNCHLEFNVHNKNWLLGSFMTCLKHAVAGAISSAIRSRYRDPETQSDTKPRFSGSGEVTN